MIMKQCLTIARFNTGTILALVLITAAGCTSPNTHTHDNAFAYANRGAAKGAKGDLDGAIVDLTKAIELRPDYADAYICRGVYKGIKGDNDGGIADLTKALQLRPNNPLAYYDRGVAKKAKGDLDGANADFTKATQLKPGSSR